MKKALLPLAALLLLAGCVSEADINAQLAKHIGQSEADLIRQMGVPNRHYTADGHSFLAYVKQYQEVQGFDAGPAFFPGYGYGFGYGFGGWGWGGFGGYDFPTDIVPYSCETDFDVAGGRVVGFARHGNDC